MGGSVPQEVKEASWRQSVIPSSAADCEGARVTADCVGPLATMKLLQETEDAPNDRKVKNQII